MSKLDENVYLSSPASTPSSDRSSINDDGNKFLIKTLPIFIRRNDHHNNKLMKWYDPKNLPIAIITVSIFQIVFHVYSTPQLTKCLRFEPNKQLELWRYFTYMLVHDDWAHLTLNIVIQCIFAALLEFNQGRFRVLIIYLLGGITGVLGAGCLHSDLVVGASAGGYALLLANVADLILNFETITFKSYRIASILTLIIFDVIYDVVHVYHKKEPQVSWQAHFFGALTGMFLGLVIFKCRATITNMRRLFFVVGLIFYLIFLISFIILTIQLHRCANDKFSIYFC